VNVSVKLLTGVLQVCQLFCCLGSIRLSDIVMNSRELPEMAAQLNISLDDLNQVMNISLNTSKVFELFVYCHVA